MSRWHQVHRARRTLGSGPARRAGRSAAVQRAPGRRLAVLDPVLYVLIVAAAFIPPGALAITRLQFEGIVTGLLFIFGLCGVWSAIAERAQAAATAGSPCRLRDPRASQHLPRPARRSRAPLRATRRRAGPSPGPSNDETSHPAPRARDLDRAERGRRRGSAATRPTTTSTRSKPSPTDGGTSRARVHRTPTSGSRSRPLRRSLRARQSSSGVARWTARTPAPWARAAAISAARSSRVGLVLS